MMEGGGQCCRVRQSSSPGIHYPSENYAKRDRSSISKKRPRRKEPRFVASTVLMAGITVVALIMSVENGKMPGVFGHEQEQITRASRRSLRPLSRDGHYAPAHEAAAAAASGRALKTEGKQGPLLPAMYPSPRHLVLHSRTYDQCWLQTPTATYVQDGPPMHHFRTDDAYVSLSSRK